MRTARTLKVFFSDILSELNYGQVVIIHLADESQTR